MYQKELPQQPLSSGTQSHPDCRAPHRYRASHVLFSPSPRRHERGLMIGFQGERIKPQIFKIFVPVSGLLLALASCQEGAPGVGSESPWAWGRGGQGAGGGSSAVGQDPQEIWACFLILSSLCWPELWRGEEGGGSQARPGRLSPNNDDGAGAPFYGRPLHRDTVQGRW